MQIDLNMIPTTLDALHAGLAALALLLLLLSILLAIISVSAFKRRQNVVPVPVETKPVPMPKAPEVSKVQTPAPVTVREATPDAALQLLSLLQQEARFVDFVQENMSAHSDADIGAAARIVHEGCRRVLKQHVELEPVRSEQENSRLTLPKGFDPSSVRVSGNIVGEPPFTGTLLHRGWRARRVNLPRLAEGHDTSILAPAEVEL